jgi:hypothetical protein
MNIQKLGKSETYRYSQACGGHVETAQAIKTAFGWSFQILGCDGNVFTPTQSPFVTEFDTEDQALVGGVKYLAWWEKDCLQAMARGD